MYLHKFDDLLSFNLPDSLLPINETEFDSNAIFGIGFNKRGENDYEHRIEVISQELPDGEALDADPSVNKLTSNIVNRVRLTKVTRTTLGVEITINNATIQLLHNRRVYELNSFTMGNDESITNWIQFINDVLSCVVIDGEIGKFSLLSKEMITDLSEDISGDTAYDSADDASYEIKKGDSPYPLATPAQNQHSHWDFLNNTKNALGMFGGLIHVNQSGTEYAFEELDDYFFDRYDDCEDLIDIGNIPVTFALANEAIEMAKIFRVSEDAFNAGEDREQEIENGLVRRCEMYEAFRSFAWTLTAYCDKKELTPEQVPFETLEGIANFVVESCGRLNYKADSFCPTLCSGDDIHNYYIPDKTPEKLRNKLAERLADEFADEADTQNRILSLESLQKDMEYLYPAMQTIYDSLATTRDFDEPLEGPIAEALYVWCSMTYALRTPVFTEDGPMNCFWEHPGEMPVLKSFGKVTCPAEAQVDCGYSFTYNPGVFFENEHYTFLLPDEFKVIQEEGRDFIAYIPNPEEPGEYLASDFIIFAGEAMTFDGTTELKLPVAYCALLGGFAQMPNTGIWYYERSDFPGIIATQIDSVCAHANALLAYEGTIKMIRFQILVKSQKQGEACEALVKSILDNMVPKKPVHILEPIDSPRYVKMQLTDTDIAEWQALLETYSQQLVFSRNTSQNNLQQNIQKNNLGLPKIKKALKEMLTYNVKHAEAYLKRADAIYQLKRAQFPEHNGLSALKSIIDEAFGELIEQFVNLGDDKVVVSADYIEIYCENAVDTPQNAIARILENCADDLEPTTVQELNAIK